MNGRAFPESNGRPFSTRYCGSWHCETGSSQRDSENFIKLHAIIVRSAGGRTRALATYTSLCCSADRAVAPQRRPAVPGDFKTQCCTSGGDDALLAETKQRRHRILLRLLLAAPAAVVTPAVVACSRRDTNREDWMLQL